MTELRTDPAALRATQPRFADLSNRVTTAATNLRSIMAAEGQCWGSDQIGQSFAKDYVPGAEEALHGTDGLATVFSGLGTNMGTIANALQSQDQGTATAITQAKS